MIHGTRSKLEEVGGDQFKTFAEVHTYVFPTSVTLHFTSIMANGVLERISLRDEVARVRSPASRPSASRPTRWPRPTSRSCRLLLLTVLDAVYVDARDAKAMVGIRPKAAFEAVLEVSTNVGATV